MADLLVHGRAPPQLVEEVQHFVKALVPLPGETVIDGEVVALDDSGRPSFNTLQNHGSAKVPIFYYVFDVMQLEGKDLTGLPLAKRKAMAEALVAKVDDAIRFSGSISAESETLIGEMKSRGLEGLIAKKKDSKYEIGRRSGAWVKFKWTNEQEFVIGGYTEPQGTRSHFGAVLLLEHQLHQAPRLRHPAAGDEPPGDLAERLDPRLG